MVTDWWSSSRVMLVILGKRITDSKKINIQELMDEGRKNKESSPLSNRGIVNVEE
jgi:hypothetical protein